MALMAPDDREPVWVTAYTSGHFPPPTLDNREPKVVSGTH